MGAARAGQTRARHAGVRACRLYGWELIPACPSKRDTGSSLLLHPAEPSLGGRTIQEGPQDPGTLGRRLRVSGLDHALDYGFSPTPSTRPGWPCTAGAQQTLRGAGALAVTNGARQMPSHAERVHVKATTFILHHLKSTITHCLGIYK